MVTVVVNNDCADTPSRIYALYLSLTCDLDLKISQTMVAFGSATSQLGSLGASVPSTDTGRTGVI